MASEQVASACAAKWRSSGLSDEVAERLAYRGLDPDETQALVGHHVPGLLLPYWGLDGKPSEFFRVRLLAAPASGFEAQQSKPQRYAQPAGTLTGVYAPPLVDWASIVKDPGREICITEGELKAACACANGIPTLGLGGVDSWRSQKRGLDMLPELKEIDWTGRLVTIIYDSDAATNVSVVRAQRQLSDALLEKGAKPKVASLPPSPAGQKQGLDDFVVACGVPALLEAIDAAEPPGEAHALWKLNEEVVYVRQEGVILVRDDGRLMTPASFTSHAFSNRKYIEEKVTETPDGKIKKKLEKKPLAPRWLDWEARFEVQRMTYKPAAPEISLDSEGRAEANAWRGWGCQPKAGDIAPWKWLLDLAFAGAPAERQWFERWCAYPIQNPGAKMYTAALLWSRVHGIGKTLIGYCLLKIYGENGREVGTAQLNNNFNAWAAKRQFILGDEITGNDNRVFADRLKGLITGHSIEINPKHVPQYTLPNVMNFLFTSNHEDAFFLEDDDRRFFVHQFSGTKADDEKYRAVDAWLHGPDGGPALFAHLLELDLGDFNPKAAAMKTKSKEQMILSAKSELSAWAAQLFDDPEGVVGTRLPGVELMEAKEVLRLFDPESRSKVTEQGMARAMRDAGIKQVCGGDQVRCAGKLRRLWAVGPARGKWATAARDAVVEQWERQQAGKKF